MSSAYNLCKQIGPRSGPTKCRAWSGSNLFDTLINFWKSGFWKISYLGQRVTLCTVGFFLLPTQRYYSFKKKVHKPSKTIITDKAICPHKIFQSKVRTVHWTYNKWFPNYIVFLSKQQNGADILRLFVSKCLYRLYPYQTWSRNNLAKIVYFISPYHSALCSKLILFIETSVDPDQLASSEITLFSSTWFDNYMEIAPSCTELFIS